MPTLISKDAFVAKDDAEYVHVDVPAWGMVRLKSLTGRARDIYYSTQFETKDGEPEFRMQDSAARLLALSLCDEEGNLWFADPEEGVRVLREKSSGALQKAFEAAMKLNGLAPGDIGESVENLDSTQSGETG